jgi:signal transduction histidine kinase
VGCPVNNNSRSDEHFEILSIHKRGNTEFVAPILVANFTLITILCYEAETEYYQAIGLTLLAFVINVPFVFFNPEVSKLRNDKADAVRWAVNILGIDMWVSILLHPPMEMMFSFWMTVIVGSFIEVYDRRLRAGIFAIATGAAMYCIHRVFPDRDYDTYLTFFAINAVSLGFIMNMESAWVKESTRRFSADKRNAKLSMQTQMLRQSHVTGHQARTIAHEVDNMLTHMNFALESEDPTKIDFGKIKSSIDHIQNAVTLILQKNTAEVRRFSVKEILEDVNTTLRVDVRGKRYEWLVECAPKLESLIIRERTGSTYHIIQNLVKNAVRAIERQGRQDGKVLLKITSEGNILTVAVYDNGTGMTEETREHLLRGTGDEIENKDHGLGMQFVLDECDQNGHKLFINRLTPTVDPWVTCVGFRATISGLVGHPDVVLDHQENIENVA